MVLANRMNVVIFGAGLVGAALGRHIAEQGHDVSFIESSADTVRKIRESMDVQIHLGSAENPEVLREAGVERADLILAVTNQDKSNIILTLIARSLNPTARIIARVRGEEYLDNRLLWQSGTLAETIVISPERAVIDKALNILEVQQAFDVVEFLDGRVHIAGFRLEKESPLVGKPLKDAIPAFKGRILVVAVDRDGEVSIPTGNFVLETDDRVFITVPEGVEMASMLPSLGKTFRNRPNFVIAGGSSTGEGLAEELEHRGFEPALIEPDSVRCREMAENLNNTIVLQGDVTDAALLRRVVNEETIFISVTPSQELNFLASMLARRLGALRAITMMDNEAYLSIAPALGVDAVVSPRLAAVGEILRFIRMGRILDSSLLLGGKLDLFLVEVEAGSKLDGVPIKRVNFPTGVIVAAAEQNHQVLVPNGDFAFKAGDKAVLVIRRDNIQAALEELIAVRR